MLTTCWESMVIEAAAFWRVSLSGVTQAFKRKFYVKCIDESA